MLDVLQNALNIFPLQSTTERAQFLLALLRVCDPADNAFLTSTIPRLHRDFFTLEQSIVTRIIAQVPAKQLCRLACVSKAYSNHCNLRQVWIHLYTRIGMQETAFPILFRDRDLVGNIRRYLTLRNWVDARYTVHDLNLTQNALLALKVVPSLNSSITNGSEFEMDVTLKSSLLVLTGGVDERLFVTDILGNLIHTSPPLGLGSITCIELYKTYVILGSSSGAIATLDLAKMQDLQSENRHTQSVNCIRVKLDVNPNCFVTCSSDKSVRLFNINLSSNNNSSMNNGKRVNNLIGTTSSQISNRKKTLLVSQTIGKDSVDINLLRSLWGHTSAVKTVDFTVNVIVSCSVDGTIRIWDMHSGNTLAIYIPSALPRPLRNESSHETNQTKILSTSLITDEVHPAIYASFMTKDTMIVTTSTGDIWWYRMRDLHVELSDPTTSIESLLKIYSSRSMFQYYRHLTLNQLTLQHEPEVKLTENLSTTRKWVLDLYLDDYKLITAATTDELRVWNRQSGTTLCHINISPNEGDLLNTEREGSLSSLAPTHQEPKVITKLWVDDYRILAISTDGYLKIVDFSDLHSS